MEISFYRDVLHKSHEPHLALVVLYSKFAFVELLNTCQYYKQKMQQTILPVTVIFDDIIMQWQSHTGSQQAHISTRHSYLQGGKDNSSPH